MYNYKKNRHQQKKAGVTQVYLFDLSDYMNEYER